MATTTNNGILNQLRPFQLRNFIDNNSDMLLSEAIAAMQGGNLTYDCPKCKVSNSSKGVITLSSPNPPVVILCDVCSGMLKNQVQYFADPNNAGQWLPLMPISADTTTVLVNSTITYTDSTTGGTWSSNNTNVATINANTGVITGVSAGTATITYTIAGLSVTKNVSVTAP